MTNTPARKIRNFVLFYKRPFTAHTIHNETGVRLPKVYKLIRKLRKEGRIKPAGIDNSSARPRQIFVKCTPQPVNQGRDYHKRLETINKIIAATRTKCTSYKDISIKSGLCLTTIQHYLKKMIPLDIIRLDPNEHRYLPGRVARAKSLALQPITKSTNHQSQVTDHGDCKEH